MAVLDYTAFLGKRVKIAQIFDDECLISTGVLVGFVKVSQDFPRFNTDEILFLQDGFDEPDYISFDELEILQ